MTYAEVKELIAMVNGSVLTNFELTMDNVSMKMSKQQGEGSAPAAEPQVSVSMPTVVQETPAPVAAAEVVAPPTEEGGNIVKAPIVGTFYAGPGGGKADFVKVGDKVQEGDTLCILEAMKIMNEVDSPYTGEIAEIYVANEELVEYGQPLFRIK